MDITALQNAYQTFFGQDTTLTHIFAPYAICPLGAHVDHQQGLVTGLAIDQGIDFLFSHTDSGKVEMASLSFNGLMTFNVTMPMYEKQQNWGDYLRGAVWALQRGGYTLRRGVKGIVRGSIPSGGVASSAALVCGFIMALCGANDINLTRKQVVHYASMAERLYIGLNNGILDHACVMLSEENELLYIDTSTQDFKLLPFGNSTPGTPPPFKVGIFYSGVDNALTNTDYNLRVQECRTAAWMLQAYADKPLGKLEDTSLHDISESDFGRFEHLMPARFARRAHHYFYENTRVKLGRQAWTKGDIQTFGHLMFDSCESSIENYECGAPELIALYGFLRHTPGVLGARFSGSGFLGSCIALVAPDQQEQVAQAVRADYLNAFPQYEGKYQSYFCNTHCQADVVIG